MRTPPKPLSLPQLGAVVAGNALEFYDFLTFSFFAAQIGATFFPGRDTASSLLFTLATFGVGFATRPLGGVVIGTLGDTWGRKPAMLLSFSLMGAAVVGLALTPSFAMIGWYAPMLAMSFRLLQGFALGGEVGPATAFLLESAPAQSRGLYVSLQLASQSAAILGAGLVGLALSKLLSPEALTQWGWRLAFLLGAAVVPFALSIRKRLPETLHETRSNPGRRRGPMGGLMLVAVVGVVTLASVTIATYTMSYTTTFTHRVLGFPVAWAPFASIATGTGAMIGAILAGLASDKVGRKPVMICCNLLLVVLTLPSVAMMVALHSLPALVTGTLVMAFLVGASAATILTSLAESLPVNLRGGSLGIIYALATAGFGGTAQFIVTWLIEVTGSPMAPAWYMTAAMAVGLVGMLGMRETAPLRKRAG
jgi:MFS family permease